MGESEKPEHADFRPKIIGEIEAKAAITLFEELRESGESGNGETIREMVSDFETDQPALHRLTEQLAKISDDEEMVRLAALFVYTAIKRKLEEKDLKNLNR